MAVSALSFVVVQVAGAAAGYALWPWQEPWHGALLGAVLAGALWGYLGRRPGKRLLRWLRDETGQPLPELPGLWGEIGGRIRSLLKKNEQQLEQSEARLKDFLAAIQTSPNGVVLLDSQGRIEWCNRTAAEHFGLDLQRDLLQYVGNLVRDPAFAAYQATQDYGHAVIMAGPASTASRPVRLAVDLHPYGEGRKLLLSRDVTALEQAETMRRDFVANVSHEIRTPLTVLSGFIETLQTLPLEPQDHGRYLSLMAQQAQRMQLLVNDLLTLSRLEGSPPPPIDEWHAVNALLEHCKAEAVALSSALNAREPHILRFEGPLGLELAGTYSELLSALSNLITNAVRYTPAGGTITVGWRDLPNGRGEFSVCDSGMGIAPEHIARLTERFYRVDRSRARETGGTGLGLSIVKHVAQRHGAQLQIASTLGQGSRFALVFPANRLRAEKPLV